MGQNGGGDFFEGREHLVDPVKARAALNQKGRLFVIVGRRTFSAPIPFRELAGAFVVDHPADRVERDRIMVVTEWSDLTARQLREIFTADDPTEIFVSYRPRVTFVINGLSWPATERLTYDLGEKVRWRVINLSSQAHPFHLHGFYRG